MDTSCNYTRLSRYEDVVLDPDESICFSSIHRNGRNSCSPQPYHQRPEFNPPQTYAQRPTKFTSTWNTLPEKPVVWLPDQHNAHVQNKNRKQFYAPRAHMDHRTKSKHGRHEKRAAMETRNQPATHRQYPVCTSPIPVRPEVTHAVVTMPTTTDHHQHSTYYLNTSNLPHRVPPPAPIPAPIPAPPPAPTAMLSNGPTSAPADSIPLRPRNELGQEEVDVEEYPIFPRRPRTVLLVYGIIVSIICCLPCGVASVCYTLASRQASQTGNEERARIKAFSARLWAHCSVGWGILLITGYLLYHFFIRDGLRESEAMNAV